MWKKHKEGGIENEERKGKEESGREWMRENKIKKETKRENGRGRLTKEKPGTVNRRE